MPIKDVKIITIDSENCSGCVSGLKVRPCTDVSSGVIDVHIIDHQDSTVVVGVPGQTTSFFRPGQDVGTLHKTNYMFKFN